VPVLAVVVLMVVVLSGITWAIALFVSISGEVPRYRDNPKRKIAAVREAGKGGVLEQVHTAAKEVTEELPEKAPAATPDDKSLPPASGSFRRCWSGLAAPPSFSSS
jgi:hypothetical protein